MPLVGRKWSLVFSALCQGIAMAMYTQVSNTAGYVGLNALEYIMQTVSTLASPFTHFNSLIRLPVLQRRPVRVSTRVVRYELPRQCQRYAILPWSFVRHRRAFCGRELPCREELWNSLVGRGRYLARCICHDLPACRDEK